MIVVLCIAIIGFSYISWKEKLATASEKKLETAPLVEEKEKKAETSKPIEETISEDELQKLTANMDEKVRGVFLNRSELGEKVQFLLVGSQAMESGEPGYGEQLKQTISDKYKGFVEIQTAAFDVTSTEFIGQETDLSVGYDVILMEPFTLNNNGLVEIEVEHEDIQTFNVSLQNEVNDAVLLLQPPQPIYGAGFYLTQVNALEEFATANDFVYINHWSAWPDTTNPLLEDYLTEESNPNNNGAKAWANELISYFVAE